MTALLYEVNFAERMAAMPTQATVTARFQAGPTPADADPFIVSMTTVDFDLTTRYGEQIVPGSINFSLGGKTYFDRLGILYNGLNVLTGEASAAGSVNYTSGAVTLTDWTSGESSGLDVKSLLTTAGDHTISAATWRIPVSPIRSGSLQIMATKATGGQLSVTVGISGTIAAPGMRGVCNHETGIVAVEFGNMVLALGNEAEPWYDADMIVGGEIWKPEFVFAETIRYNAVAYSYLPLDADLLGLDPVRLPQDGRVPIFRIGGYAVVGHTKSLTATVANGQTIDCARVRLSRVRIVGSDGNVINTGYTANLESGLVTINNITGWLQPVTIEDRIEDMVRVTDVQISGQLGFSRHVTHNYPVPGSYVSSALVAQNLKARVSQLFDQGSWDGITWQDSRVGDPASATYNDLLAPIVVTNAGAVTERWAFRFTSSSAFDIIGEHVGVVGTGSVNEDCAPINPATNVPYFTLPALGWGLGWPVGAVLFMKTVGAMFPVWAARTIQQGAESVQDDSFTLLVRGDVNRP